MALAGRAAALKDLDGEGKVVLAARMPTQSVPAEPLPAHSTRCERH